MIRNLINSIERIEIPSASKKYEITRILKKYDGRAVYIKDVDGYEVIGNLCNRENIAKSLGIQVKDLMGYMLNAMDNEKNGEIIINNNLKKGICKGKSQ